MTKKKNRNCPKLDTREHTFSEPSTTTQQCDSPISLRLILQVIDCKESTIHLPIDAKVKHKPNYGYMDLISLDFKAERAGFVATGRLLTERHTIWLLLIGSTSSIKLTSRMA
ncbi:hypothetical protein M758_10G123600 [Ceratodon purpureus]|nr:hypothetical protein M758_10G123600 [Ceratodon purpureus]